ncbi:hypothetical protein PGT21_016947 [Puccinia graminis f. sp. tritici]|uniref:Uncharacterized protein n=1 Tax=Puccinia graminis f. sp. tritici TaxID=56615 RepID=A0A5B0QS90_PUCGR|nr:hypothetical protein PGTUg99_011198 [Puccinia graminis f. sp. tritici]KAA1092871.1 hypothetical protein PGT21_016947 [Puccinia graminis f. sp. tritici]KAA1115795.1 hypothetical protein PGTUg99_032146 [Puccinia graminis f. sp. tritici]
MPAFEGEGGKKRKRTRKPTSSAGIALKEALELESQHALISQPTQQNSSGEFQQPEHLSPQFQLHDVENLAHDDNPEPQSPTPNSTTDPQVTSLLDYFRSEHYKKKKDLEEKHWAEVYPGMFSWFSQCATKTSDWGNEDVWNYDWKERCTCNHTRTRHVVLDESKNQSTFVNAKPIKSDSSKWDISEVPPSFPRQLSQSACYSSTMFFGNTVQLP